MSLNPATLLLEQFDHLLTTPKAVEELNRAILTLAMQGKLVEQDRQDEPVSELLKRIRAEKDKLLLTGQLRRDEPLSPIEEGEILYELPPGWTWVRLEDISTIRGGKRVPAGYQLLETPTNHIYIRVSDMKNGTIVDTDLRYISEDVFEEIKNYIIESSDLYITIAGTIGAVGDVPEKFHGMNLTENAARITPYLVNKAFLKLALNSRFVQEQFSQKTNQMAQPKLALIRIRSTIFSLPPLAEQKRIVARVEGLFAQTRQLAEKLARAQHDLAQLNQSALAHLLAAETPEDFARQWAFIAQNFDNLFIEPEHITPLRQAILELAVRGKLTRREPTDEPASMLLAHIQAEKAKVRKVEPLPLVKANEKSFNLPGGWEWVRFGIVGEQRLGKMLDKNKNKGEYYPYLRNLNVQWLKIDLSDVSQMRFEADEIDEYKLEKGDLLICEGGEPGRCAIWEEDTLIMFQKAIHRVRPYANIVSKYLLYHLWADAGNGTLEKYFTGATIKHLTGKSLANYILALPPLAEQKRIVAKVEHLLGLCDALEAKLRSAREERIRLTAAVLAGVGNGAGVSNSKKSRPAAASSGPPIRGQLGQPG